MTLTPFEHAIVRNLRRAVGDCLSTTSDEEIYAAWLRLFRSADCAEPRNIVKYLERNGDHERQDRDAASRG